MSTRSGPVALQRRSEGDIALDLEVALRIEGYRWVQWSHDGLREAPVYERGRFIGHPGDMAAQHYADAPPEMELAEWPYRRLPHYSSDPGLAIRAAERAGLFRGGGVVLSSTASGSWSLRAADNGFALGNDCLPRLLCQAALERVRRRAAEGVG